MEHFFIFTSKKTMQKEDEEKEYFIKATSYFFVCLPISIPFSLPDDMIRMRPISATPLGPGGLSRSECLNQ